MFLGTNYIYDTYSKPDDSIPWMTENKHFISNITKNTVKKSPNLENVLLSFLEIISDFNNINPIFIAHNSSFNKDILNLCFDFYNIKCKYNKWCNTMNKDFFNVRGDNGKFIRSLKKISKNLLNENEYKNDILNNSKYDIFILYKCLLKIHKCDDKISSIIFKSININEKNEDHNEDEKINFSNILSEYYNIINKEKEILNNKMIIEDEIKKLLKNKDYVIIDNKKITYKEITLKNFLEENIKNNYKKIYITDI
jgi:DNA polymerase III epsilon subunit-like protein